MAAEGVDYDRWFFKRWELVVWRTGLTGKLLVRGMDKGDESAPRQPGMSAAPKRPSIAPSPG